MSKDPLVLKQLTTPLGEGNFFAMLSCNKDMSGRQWECNDGTMKQRQNTTGIKQIKHVEAFCEVCQGSWSCQNVQKNYEPWAQGS
jgi:hypothetical protein